MKNSNEIEQLCRKLKPVIGEKADRLWYMYLAEDDKGRRELALEIGNRPCHVSTGEKAREPIEVLRRCLNETLEEPNVPVGNAETRESQAPSLSD